MGQSFKLFLTGLFFVLSFHVKAITPEQVPEPLKPWVKWVLQDQLELGCPFIYNSYEEKSCSWPTQLNLDFSASSGKFTIDWNVYRESWIKLPGNQEHWPQNVTANDKSVAVVAKDGMPSVKMQPGYYQLKGDFFWNHIPESLNIPADTGLVSLQVNHTVIPKPSIRDGQLWLTENEIGQKKPENIQNTLDVQVFRLITDDVPMQVMTYLVLDVSGEQREVKLALPLLDGFIPLGLTSDLPARIEPDGQLLVQVRPGQWHIDINSRSTKETNSLSLNSQIKDWPASEIWVFNAQPQLRVVEVEKLLPIDSSQTNSPEIWRHLPTYNVNQGESLTLKIIRRGNPDPEPNHLTLQRKLWLDFDGGGYTIHDVIGGKITKDWRLDAQADTQLGKVDLNGNDQLITLNQKTGKQGVEVRQGSISLGADSRQVGNINRLNAVGWEQSFNTVNAELNLPPSWQLLAASGVDNVPNSWVSRWTLLDLFLVLIAALATSRLFNRRWGWLALLTLTLIWHEYGAPQFIWLNILAATALIRVLPAGKFFTAVTWYRNISWLLLVLTLVPFMVNQVRTGIYPQLENPWADIAPPYVQSQSGNVTAEAEMAMKPATPAASPEAKVAESVTRLESDSYSRRVYEKSKRLYKQEMPKEVPAEKFVRTDPDAKVQTGPGLPQWQWNRVGLSWNGSVEANQQLRLWYLSPKMVMLLNFIRVILVCGLALVMFGLIDKLRLKPKTSAQVLLWFLALPLFSLPSPKAHADMPSQEVLEELKKRLLEAPDCLPNCAQIPQMQVKVNEKELTIFLQIHAQESVNVPLPASYEQWFPNQVEVDGKAAQSLYRQDNSLWLNVTTGEHQVTLRGLTPVLPTFTLPLNLKPNRVTVENSGWQVSGIQDNGQIENQLQFNRISQSNAVASDKRLAPGVLPPFVRIERTLQLGLDWHVANQVKRLSPADSAIVLEISLLPGEKVTTSGIQVKDGKIQANLAAQQADFSWESNLDKTENLGFIAANTSQWIEVWKADISPIWHLETKGIAMMQLNNEGQWLPEWHPWPGESLSLQVTRPKSVEGQTLTIDKSQLTFQPGLRSSDTGLTFTIRSSQGTQHTMHLPEKAVMQALMINGQTQPIHQEGDRLTLPINPGEQEIAISWEEPTGVSWLTKTPKVDLGAPSVNSKLNMSLGQDRWVLFVWGPKLGPAVLFWGVLAVIFILAIGLSKIPLTPLRSWQWALLLLGLSQIPLESAALSSPG